MYHFFTANKQETDKTSDCVEKLSTSGAKNYYIALLVLS